MGYGRRTGYYGEVGLSLKNIYQFICIDCIMAGDANALLSGTAMAVLIGGGSILAAIFLPDINMGSRIILFFLGLFFFWAGLRFSQG